MVRVLSNRLFPSGNIPRVFAQVATSKSILVTALGPYPVLAAALGPKCSLRCSRRPNLTFGKFPLGVLHIWEVVTQEIDSWEVALEKIRWENT